MLSITRTMLAGAALAVATPALADEPIDNETPIVVSNYRIKPAAAVTAIETPVSSYRIERDLTRRAAMRWEMAFVALSAADLIMTVQCIEAKKCVEANPLAKSHSTGKMIAIKSALTLGHFLFVKRLSERDPKAALRVAQMSVAVQGGVVALNARVIF
jgi:hypothetical protein